MGIEDQSIQAFQALGRPPSAPQLAPSTAPVGAPPPQQMLPPGIDPRALQDPAWMKGFQEQQQMMSQMEAARRLQAQQGPVPDQNGMSNLRQMDMMARPQPFQQNIAPPWLTQRPEQQDMYKPQFGAMSSSLHQIADQLKQASGGGQLGKFDGGKFGQTGAGLSGLGGSGLQALGGMGDMFSKFKAAQQNPMQQQTMEYRPQIQNQSMMGGMVPGSNMNAAGQIAYVKGGDVDSGLASAAKKLAAKGRKGDSILVHMSPEELKGLQAIAKDHGMHLTVNPHTGLIEAWSLKKTFKKIGSAVKSVAKVVAPVVAPIAKVVKDTVGPIVTKVRDAVQTGLNVATFGATKGITSKGATENFNKIKDKVGPIFTKLRDTVESAAVLAGNYFVPGSSFLTQNLVSKGSQKQLSSGIGQGLMALSGGLAGAGGGLSALKSGFSNVLKNGISGLGASAMSGLKSLGTNALSGLKNLASQGIGAVKNFMANPMEGIKTLGQKGMDYLKEKVQDLGLDKATEWISEKVGGIGEGIGDAVEGAGYALENAGDAIGDAMGGSGEGGYGADGGTGAGTGAGGGGGTSGGSNPNDLAKILGSLYAAKHPFEDPREKQGITNLPKPQFQNTQLKQVPNPNYGKPGEPFYLSQEFTPAQAADAPTPAAGGGLMSSGYAAGGPTRYAGGGNVYEYAAGGKLLDGPGDGMSDSIPAEIRGKRVQKALLADGEFVIPADVVSHLGNGSTKAGSKVLYSMMDRVRQARTGNPEQGKQINPNKFVPV